MRASACCGVSPSGERIARPDSACPSKPATRTWKNSSMFDEKIAQNRARSSSGIVSFAASSRTRPWKSSIESSRLSSGSSPSVRTRVAIGSILSCMKSRSGEHRVSRTSRPDRRSRTAKRLLHHIASISIPDGDTCDGRFAAVEPAVLESIPLFSGLEATRRDQLAGVCSEVDFDAGATVVHEGDFGFAMYAIVSGDADVVHDGEVIRTLAAGDVFGEIAVLSSGRRTASVVARTPMRLVAVMNRDLWKLEAESPDVATSLR